jgi:hypothetical protein
VVFAINQAIKENFMENEQNTLPGKFRFTPLLINAFAQQDGDKRTIAGDPSHEYNDLVEVAYQIRWRLKDQPTAKSLALKGVDAMAKVPPERRGEVAAAALRDPANNVIVDFVVEEKIDGSWQPIDPVKLSLAKELEGRRQKVWTTTIINSGERSREVVTREL